MNDLTLLYYTANKIPETFGQNVRNHLVSLFPEGIPIISVSHKPIDFGKNIHVEGFEYSIYNIYKQILIGAKEATTKYVACCEDDALYPREHFEYRPKDDEFAYNINRYLVNKDCFFSPRRACMCTCIASRELMIETLEKRFEKYPNLIMDRNTLRQFGEPGRSEERLGLPIVNWIKFETKTPMLVFNHFPSVGGVRKIKDTAIIAKYLEGWGEAEKLWNNIGILKWHWNTKEENWWKTKERYENNTRAC